MTSSWRRSRRASASEAGSWPSWWRARRSGSKAYRFSSTGGGSGSFCRTPARPAWSMAANARYGLHEGSGARNSTRIMARSPLPARGTRISADRFICAQLIRALECVTEPEVELVLAGRDLVVAGLDRDSEMVQPVHDLLPDFAPQVARMVEVAGPVVPPGTHAGGRVGVQQEELQLDRDGVIEAQRTRLRLSPGEHAPRIARKPLPLRGQQVADHLGAGRCAAGRDGERVQVRTEEHVALEHASEAFHRRAVEPLAIAHGVRQPLRRNRDALYRSEDVDEAQIQEADAALGQALQRAVDGDRRRTTAGRFSLRRRGLLCAPSSTDESPRARTGRVEDDRQVARACRVLPDGPYVAPL